MSGPLTLALEAATSVGSVALLAGARVVAELQVEMRGPEGRLAPAVAALFGRIGRTPADLARVACGAGPGSFTSLRVAAALAKGIATGRAVPLVAAPSLLLMLLAEPREPGRYLTVLDALRGEVFVAGYELRAGGRVAALAPAALLPRTELAERARALAATPIGPGEDHAAAPHARAFAALLDGAPGLDPVDLSRWEPDYGRPAEAEARWERDHGRPFGRP